jgi:hypothetical protein
MVPRSNPIPISSDWIEVMNPKKVESPHKVIPSHGQVGQVGHGVDQ